jgi:hypothetical protein
VGLNELEIVPANPQDERDTMKFPRFSTTLTLKTPKSIAKFAALIFLPKLSCV